MGKIGIQTALQALAILIVGSLGAVLHAQMRPFALHGMVATSAPATGENPGSGATEGTDGTTPPAPDDAAKGIRAIDVKSARALYDANGAAFIDARELDEYEAGHVPGAFWLPFNKFFTGRPPEVIEVLPRDQPLILYCQGGDCHSSHQVADMLLDQGFGDVRVLEAGWPGWSEGGHPRETGLPLVGN